jgi:hypothetical protein
MRWTRAALRSRPPPSSSPSREVVRSPGEDPYPLSEWKSPSDSGAVGLNGLNANGSLVSKPARDAAVRSTKETTLLVRGSHKARCTSRRDPLFATRPSRAVAGRTRLPRKTDRAPDGERLVLTR